MPRLQTLGSPGKRTWFSYSHVVGGVVLDEQRGRPRIDARFLDRARHHFSGQTVLGGFKEDGPPVGSFGAWVEADSRNYNSRNLTPRHGSFMAAILCSESGVRNWLNGRSVVLSFPEEKAQ